METTQVTNERENETMTEKQIKAALRMLKTLARSRELIENQKTIGCLILEETKKRALASNAECVQIIEERLRLAEQWAA